MICSRPQCENTFDKAGPKKYCSSSCAAKVNNVLSPKRFIGHKRKERYCQFCSGTHFNTLRKYCSDKCMRDSRKTQVKEAKVFVAKEKNCLSCGAIFTNAINPRVNHCSVKCSSNVSHKKRTEEKIQLWLSGEWSGGSTRSLSDTIRNHLLREANYCCSSCGFNTPHPSDDKTILEIDHIDGDGTNHRPENLKVLCPNCHALTPTYRARNMGNGRPTYYLRVSK